MRNRRGFLLLNCPSVSITVGLGVLKPIFVRSDKPKSTAAALLFAQGKEFRVSRIVIGLKTLRAAVPILGSGLHPGATAFRATRNARAEKLELGPVVGPIATVSGIPDAALGIVGRCRLAVIYSLVLIHLFSSGAFVRGSLIENAGLSPAESRLQGAFLPLIAPRPWKQNALTSRPNSVTRKTRRIIGADFVDIYRPS